ncbi:MAG: hypothetical protein MHM6MM_001507 [Cercozoa sp. M6MM]
MCRYLGTAVLTNKDVTDVRQYLLAAGLLGAVLATRSKHGMAMGIVLLFNSVVSATLKRVLHGEITRRPDDSFLDGKGMPSHHAMFVLCFSVLLFRVYRNWLARLLSLAVSFLVCWSRVYLGVHTTPQVAAGMLLGAFVGAVFPLDRLPLCQLHALAERLLQQSPSNSASESDEQKVRMTNTFHTKSL